VHHLLLIRLNAYTDLDFGELIQTHIDTQSSLTRVYGLTRALDIAVIDANSLQDSGDTYCKALREIIFRQRRFSYRGYVNALAGLRQLRQIVEHGLHGLSGLKPVGIQVRPGIWYGTGARVHGSATIQAPAFIGMGSHISASCTVDQASAIEHGCVVEYKSTIRQSCLLQNTHVGIGLHVQHAIVFDNRLAQLDRGVEINCDQRLIGSTSRSGGSVWSLRRRRFQERVTTAKSKLLTPASVDSTATSEAKLA
jgi:NDP-sugar pyrophosphorylase family protein